MIGQAPGRTALRQESIRLRVVNAARAAMSYTGEFTPQLLRDVRLQTGLTHGTFRAIFPTDDALLDAVDDVLVEQCAARLATGVASFVPPSDPQKSFVAAAAALAGSWPLDRVGLLIRAQRRIHAITAPVDAAAVLAGEMRYVGAVTGTLTELVHKLGRRFEWTTGLAVRVILDTYERSFEAWLMGGHSEAIFETSTYVSRTLPALLERTTVPIDDQPPEMRPDPGHLVGVHPAAVIPARASGM